MAHSQSPADTGTEPMSSMLMPATPRKRPILHVAVDVGAGDSGGRGDGGLGPNGEVKSGRAAARATRRAMGGGGSASKMVQTLLVPVTRRREIQIKRGRREFAKCCKARSRNNRHSKA
eukprot:69115-Alexandrium_andersonii.AAC.1